jgi:hypothetical protein
MGEQHEDDKAEPGAEHNRGGKHMHELDGQYDVNHGGAKIGRSSPRRRGPGLLVLNNVPGFPLARE